MEYYFAGELTLDDYIQFNKNYYKNSFFRKFKFIFYLFLLGIVIYIFISEMPNLLEVETEILLRIITQPHIMVYMILIFFMIVYFVFFNSKIMRIIYKKYYDANKLMTELKYYNITENTITIKSNSENTILTKDKINKIRYDKTSIYIYTGLNIAYIIKEHFFDKKKEFEKIVKFINENFDANK
jgi:hypothetical protein